MQKDQRHLRQAHADTVYEIVSSPNSSAQSFVAASWSRSLNTHQLNPDEPAPAIRLDAASLKQRRERLSRVMHTAEPVLDRLYSALSLTGCAVVLCDQDGIIIDQRSSAADTKAFENAELVIGADWSEVCQGTNGIGTCIAEKRTIVVQENQHFKTSNISMTCVGTPVFGVDGALSAVLDISACNRDLDKATAALIAQTAKDAAAQIEADHFADVYSHARIVRGTAPSLQGPVLLALDKDDLVIGATRSARKLYKLEPTGSITIQPAADILNDGEQRGQGLPGAERRTLRRALSRAGGNVSAAARDLGMSRATFYRRATKLNIFDD